MYMYDHDESMVEHNSCHLSLVHSAKVQEASRSKKPYMYYHPFVAVFDKLISNLGL